MCYTNQYAHCNVHCINPDICTKTKMSCDAWWHFIVLKWWVGRSWILPQLSCPSIVLMIKWEKKMKAVVRANLRVLSYGFPVATSRNFWPCIKSWYGRDVFRFSWEHSADRLSTLQEFPNPLSVHWPVVGKSHIMWSCLSLNLEITSKVTGKCCRTVHRLLIRSHLCMYSNTCKVAVVIIRWKLKLFDKFNNTFLWVKWDVLVISFISIN